MSKLGKLKRAYVAGPYTAATQEEIGENILRARKVAGELWKAGYNVYCPHMNSAYMGAYASYEHFMACCKEEVANSDFVVLVPGWASSKGTQREILLTRELNIPVYLTPEMAIDMEGRTPFKPANNPPADCLSCPGAEEDNCSCGSEREPIDLIDALTRMQGCLRNTKIVLGAIKVRKFMPAIPTRIRVHVVGEDDAK